jgi:hypothetical protein
MENATKRPNNNSSKKKNRGIDEESKSFLIS